MFNKLLREIYACVAMKALLKNRPESALKYVAEDAYIMADYMLKARKGKNK